MKERHTRDLFVTVCGTSGGCESWAQVELERVFRREFDIAKDADIREQSRVYDPVPGAQRSKVADFLLPQTDLLKGMVIELKCENKNSKGGAFETPVQKDMDKRYEVNPKYKDHTFVAVAMAFTDKAQKALIHLGMKPIDRATQTVKGKGKMTAYKKNIPSSEEVTATMDDLSQTFAKLFITPGN
ncbi:hypothetical protein CC80DRAFT_495630 [Byssothecium circinans]|uniref:Uncharacterized protein n=1 Tax=Byssothecium circinans TaxID=147558 RepID=A0A6A5TIJ6_9PLEO|nr:hypothetical protein CC80DRAFT_495630 [Byssothecium circinans]